MRISSPSHYFTIYLRDRWKTINVKFIIHCSDIKYHTLINRIEIRIIAFISRARIISAAVHENDIIRYRETGKK